MDSSRIDVLGKLDRFVTIKTCTCSRPSCVHDWSPRIDRAWLVRGPIAILELVHDQSGYVSVVLGQLVFGSIEIRTRFCHEILCKDSFYEE
ncbi:hypothetical protein YC2023_098845 [Brassica napus]